MKRTRMSLHYAKFRTIFIRWLTRFFARTTVTIPSDPREFAKGCRDLAFWSASDAGLDGPVEAFDGSQLHPAADGMCTIRMTLRDTEPNRAPAQAAAAIVRSVGDLRVLLLLEIDGCRFVNMAPNVNPGVRELGKNYTNRTGRAG
jgi:hypothetical protein